MNMSKTKCYEALTQDRLDKEMHKNQKLNSVTNKTQ